MTNGKSNRGRRRVGGGDQRRRGNASRHHRGGRGRGVNSNRDAHHKLEVAADRLQMAALHLAEGRTIEALEAAGEAVYLDPNQVGGYVLIGDTHLQSGDLVDAREAYETALSKIERRMRDPRKEELLHFTMLEAQFGIARCALLADSRDESIVALNDLIRLDSSDPLGARQLLAEAHLAGGDPRSALTALLPIPLGEHSRSEVVAQALAPLAEVPLSLNSLPTVTLPLPPDGHLVAAFAHQANGSGVPASLHARLALMGNLYFMAAILDEPPPDYQLAHGFEEATPEYAMDAALRLKSFLDGHQESLDFLVNLATTPTVMKEVQGFIDAAHTLNTTDDPTVRESSLAEIQSLRDPARLLATTIAVV